MEEDFGIIAVMDLKLFAVLAVTINFLSVLSLSNDNILEHDPQVAMWCGKLNQHKDVKTGKWVSSENMEDTCKTEKKDILRYCKKAYAKLDIRNIVEANQAVVINKWCDPARKDCTGTNDHVVPYRCLVGEFEADALLVPDGCNFEHLHKSSKCKSHDQWKVKAAEKCKAQGKHLQGYGVLLPCAVDKFTGVEFVCCPKKPKETKSEVKDVKVIALTETPTEVETPTSSIDDLEALVAKFAKSVPAISLGCDRKKFHFKRQKMEDEHRKRVSTVIKQWEDAEKRYNVIKKDDPSQAESMIKGVMDRFKKTVASLEEQAKLERERLRDEHHQCVQIDVNNKKHKAMKDFVKSMKETVRDPNKILEAVQRFVKVCTQDRLHNLRHFEFVKKHSPKKAEDIRGILQQHLRLINQHVNQSMILLYKLPEIARHFRFILPDWAPKPPTPMTEKPTTVALPELKSTSSPTEGPVPTERPTEIDAENTPELYSTVKPALDDEEDDEGEPENNEHGEFDARTGDRKEKKPWGDRSPTTLAAVIGLSCGALVIMVIIIIVMAVRRTGSSRGPTKTVLVNPDNQSSDKQHLLEMQKNGYENPTYKLFDY